MSTQILVLCKKVTFYPVYSFFINVYTDVLSAALSKKDMDACFTAELENGDE